MNVEQSKIGSGETGSKSVGLRREFLVVYCILLIPPMYVNETGPVLVSNTGVVCFLTYFRQISSTLNQQPDIHAIRVKDITVLY